MYLTLDDINVSQKHVLIREDLNVPLANGKITSDERIQRALPTIKQVLAANAKVMVMSHLGRPTEGEYQAEFSLAPVAQALTEVLGQPVRLVNDWLNGVDVSDGEVVLLENVRFNVGEKKNDSALAKQMAALCDVFVMDAFATAHRAQASTVGVATYAPIACAGPLLDAELKALGEALTHPKHPVTAIVGGSKVSTKIQLLESLLQKVDCLIVGGGIANTFLKAAGFEIGQSLFEADWVDNAKQLLQRAEQQGVRIPLPVDVRVAKTFSDDAVAVIKAFADIEAGDLILDVGPKTQDSYPELMQQAATIVWNGPVGVFEFAAFSEGTQALADAIANADAYSLAGGGDTLAALAKFGVRDRISYVSTGGGAFLEFMEGKPLPAVVELEKRNKAS